MKPCKASLTRTHGAEGERAWASSSLSSIQGWARGRRGREERSLQGTETDVRGYMRVALTQSRVVAPGRVGPSRARPKAMKVAVGQAVDSAGARKQGLRHHPCRLDDRRTSEVGTVSVWALPASKRREESPSRSTVRCCSRRSRFARELRRTQPRREYAHGADERWPSTTSTEAIGVYNPPPADDPARANGLQGRIEAPDHSQRS